MTDPEHKVRAVLLVPDKSKMGLLEEGPCGARPPVALEWRMLSTAAPNHWTAGRSLTQNGVPTARRALVLAWDGELVSVGCFLLGEAATDEGDMLAGVEALVRQTLAGHPESLIEAASAWGWGTIVIIHQAH